MIDHDRLFKELLSNFFPEFIELFFPDISAEWERDSVQFLPLEVITDVTEGEKKILDIVVQASLKGQDTLFIIHTEHQSYSQPGFNRRMFTYFARLHEKYALPIYPIVIYSHDSPKIAEPNSYRLELANKIILEFNYDVIQLNQLHWQDFVNQRNPVASALMAKMRMSGNERPQVKLTSLQLLTSLGLNAAQVQLISGFIDTYLELNSQEEVVFQEQLVTIEPKQQEEVMQIVTSWMRQGLEQGEKQGELKLLMRLLNRRLGEISPQIKGRIENLSTPELENLGEALLDFSSVADLEAWFENIS
ncbi:Rpn family recombination-promoting nuclease/putative transposase [Nostoc sp. C117]|uniref:Rpn family recombination-promoting nuclease/putative transposase n=1 Tax=Nostoc sp. C117 TaxID=3349875 RepID=UPI00370DC757